MTSFKFIDRGKQKTLVLIPGWAADYKIFADLNLDFNYLILPVFSPDNFAADLLAALKENKLCQVSLFGWSMGGFLAAAFARLHQDLVDQLFLVSVRKKYQGEKITEIKDLLQRSKRGYLAKFYQECCSSSAEWLYFKENLLATYMEFDLTYLMEGLDYLTERELKTTYLQDITIIHGQKDKIAPLTEALLIKEELPAANFLVVENAGHFPFFHPKFSELLNVK